MLRGGVHEAHDRLLEGALDRHLALLHVAELAPDLDGEACKQCLAERAVGLVRHQPSLRLALERQLDLVGVGLALGKSGDLLLQLVQRLVHLAPESVDHAHVDCWRARLLLLLCLAQQRAQVRLQRQHVALRRLLRRLQRREQLTIALAAATVAREDVGPQLTERVGQRIDSRSCTR